MEARVTALHQLNGEKLSEFGGGMAAEVDVLACTLLTISYCRASTPTRRTGRR
jgi:hypothetical protein